MSGNAADNMDSFEIVPGKPQGLEGKEASGNHKQTVAVIVTAFSTNLNRYDMELKDIIPSAQMLEGSTFSELILTDRGRISFQAIYGFKGKLLFHVQDMGIMIDLMRKTLKTDKYIVEAHGFIAGHLCEFTGEIVIGVKKQ